MGFRPPAKPETQDLFAGLAGDAYSRRARLLSLGQEPRWHRYLVDRLPVGPEHHVLDVCTGTGAVAERIVLTHRCRVTGLDQSTAMLELASARVPDAGFVQSDALRLPFQDGTFERIFTSHFYGHLEDPERGRFLAEARRVAPELVVVDSALRDEVEPAEQQERILSDGSRWQVFKRYFEPGVPLGAELGIGNPNEGCDLCHGADRMATNQRPAKMISPPPSSAINSSGSK